MSNHYVPVPSETLEAYLQSLRFERTTLGREVVYVRRSVRNPNVWLKVYTSIRIGSTAVRAAGSDSIKVCCVFDNGHWSFGIGKFPPIFRVVSVESVLARLFEKLKLASARASEWMDQEEARRPQLRTEFQQRAADKASYAAYEAAQERNAFMNDPDMFQAQQEELACEEDPCSEPPETVMSYEQYRQRVTCPDGCC